jgi:hypothetical protein
MSSNVRPIGFFLTCAGILSSSATQIKWSIFSGELFYGVMVAEKDATL